MERLVKEREILLHRSGELTNQLEEERQKVKDFEERLHLIENLRSASDKDMTNLQERLHDFQLKIASTASENASLSEEIGQLHDRIQSKNTEIALMDTKKAELMTELEHCQQELLYSRQREDHQRALTAKKIQQIEQQSYSLKKEAKHFQDLYENLLHTQKEDSNCISNLLKDIELHKKEIDTLKVQEETWKTRWDERENQIQQQVKEAKRTSFAYSNTDSQVIFLSEKLEEIQNKYKESQDNVKHLETKLSTYVKEFEDKLPILKQQKSKYESLIVNYTKVKWSLDQSNTKCFQLSQDLEFTQGLLKDLEAECDNLKNTNNFLQKQNKSLILENLEMKNISGSESSNVQDLHTKYTQLQIKLEEIEKEKETEKQEALREYKQEVVRLKDRLRTVENDFEALSMKYGDYDKLGSLELFYKKQTESYNALVEEKEKISADLQYFKHLAEDLSERETQNKGEIHALVEQNRIHSSNLESSRLSLSDRVIQLEKSYLDQFASQEKVRTMEIAYKNLEHLYENTRKEADSLLASCMQSKDLVNKLEEKVLLLQEQHTHKVEELVQEKNLCFSELKALQKKYQEDSEKWKKENSRIVSELNNFEINIKKNPDNAMLVEKLKELSQFENARDRMEMLEEEVRNLSKRRDEAHESANYFKECNDILLGDIQRLRDAHVRMENQLATDKQEIGISSSQFSELLALNEYLQSDKNAIEEQLGQYMSENHELKREVENMSRVVTETHEESKKKLVSLQRDNATLKNVITNRRHPDAMKQLVSLVARVLNSP